MTSLAVPPFLWSDTGDFDSPVEYTVPGSGEVQPYTATATFTNASGQAILPALRIKSAAGNLLALTFPVGQTIADGTASEVTFVPPFGSAQGSSPAPPTPTTFPWCRVRMWNNLADQTITSGPIQTMKFNDNFNTDATVFTPSTGVTNQIKVLKDGLYSIRARMFWDTTPTVAMIALNGIDTDAWAPYMVTADFQNVTETGFVATLARLQANQIIFVTVRQASGVNKALYGQGGNFLEMQRIGDTTTQDLAGGP